MAATTKAVTINFNFNFTGAPFVNAACDYEA